MFSSSVTRMSLVTTRLTKTGGKGWHPLDVEITRSEIKKKKTLGAMQRSARNPTHMNLKPLVRRPIVPNVRGRSTRESN